MPIEPGAESDLIILKNINCGYMKNGSQIDSFMERGRFCGAVSNPGQRNRALTALLEGKSYSRKYRRERCHLAYRRDDAMKHAAQVEISALTRRIGGGEIFAKHVGNRHSHFVTRSGVSNHRADFIGLSIESVYTADGDSLFPRAEPCFCENPLFHPAAKCNVVQTEAQQARVHVQELGLIKLGDDLGPLRIPANGVLVFFDEAGSERPIHVLRWVKHRVALHTFSVYSIVL